MSDKGIIFSAPMVRALLDGKKHQTRRLLNPQPAMLTGSGKRIYEDTDCKKSWQPGADDDLPFHKGQRLYVRENFQLLELSDFSITKTQPADVRFAATDALADMNAENRGYPWRPCIHMPRWASRITLWVWRVTVQRLQDITEAEARGEGVAMVADRNYRDGFAILWNSLHQEAGTRWEDNPFVVAVHFDVGHHNIDGAPAQ